MFKYESVYLMIKNHKNIIPLLLLTLISFNTLSKFIEVNYIENKGVLLSHTTQHYLGFVFVIINYVMYFYLKKYYKHLMLLTLFLGLFNVIQFNLDVYTCSFGMNAVKLHFQPFVFVVILITYILNRKQINRFLADLI